MQHSDGTHGVRVGVEAWLGVSDADADADPGSSTSVGPPPHDPVAAGPAEDHEAVARTILLNQLTGRARSRRELADKLASKAVPDELAERLLNRFEEVGLVDDAAFARAWVESRQRGKGLARRALTQELRRKGIADDLVRDAVEGVDPEDELASARELVRRKSRTMARLDRATATRRLVGMLARKGYPPGDAYRVVRDELDARSEADSETDDASDFETDSEAGDDA